MPTSALHPDRLTFLQGKLHKLAEYNSDRAVLALNKYKPLSERRTPDPDEAADIAREKAKWFPNLISTPGEPVTEDLSSPGRQAILFGALAGLMGTGAGLKGTQFAKKQGLVPADIDEKKVAAVSGVSTAALAAMAAYVNRYLRNQSREDMVLRMPRGSTLRDLQLNPIYQMEQDPEQASGIRQTALLSAALRGRFNEKNFQVPDEGK